MQSAKQKSVYADEYRFAEGEGFGRLCSSIFVTSNTVRRDPDARTVLAPLWAIDFAFFSSLSLALANKNKHLHVCFLARGGT